MLTETHLKPEILDAEVKVEGWSLYRADRGPGKSHGGVAIYLRNDLIGQLVVAHSSSMCETLVVKVKALNLLLACLYRPPDSTFESFKEALSVSQKAIDEVTDNDTKVKDVLMFGDFNLPFISWPSGKIYDKNVTKKAKEKQQAELLVNFVENNFMENYINTATRGQNILDLVFSNNHHLVNKYTTTINNKFSDHNMLTVEMNFTYNKEKKSTKSVNPTATRIYEYDLKNATNDDWMKFSKVLEEVAKSFEEETKEANTEEKLLKLYSHAERATAIVFQKKKDFIDEEEAKKKESMKPRNKIPKKVRVLMRRKKKLSSKILSSTSWRKNFKTMQEIRKVEEEIDANYKERRNKEENEAIKAMKKNPKFFYCYAKKFSKTNTEIAAFDKEDGESTDDPEEQAEMLQAQYESVASEPKKEFEVEPNFFTKEDECSECKEEKVHECKEDISENPETKPTITDIYFSVSDVSKCIEMMSAGAAAGPDGIPAAMLKGAKTTFAIMISDILRTSLDSGNIPNVLKLAHIIPLHKGGNRAEPSNYRPISLTSHLIKTMERVVRAEMVSYLEFHMLMDPRQHGSRVGRSTLSQLLVHQDEVLKALEEGFNIDTIYTDFSKAFDKCDFGILLHKIKKLGIKGKLGRWIQSFLNQRQQKVMVNKMKSTGTPLKSGIPQGSVLGPILFLIYISDIGKDLLASTLVYVDDAKVKQKIKTENDVENLQNELIKLDNWCSTNNMVFNKKKFQVIRYGQDESLKSNTTYFSGNYDETIERFESLRDLGVQLSEDGTFSQHIENVCKKARQKGGWILRTFFCRNINFMKQMFNVLVQPHIDYCSQLWMPQEGSKLEMVEKVMRDYTRRIPELRGLNYTERLKKLSMNSQQRRLERYQLLYTWKVMEGLVPNPGLTWSPAEARRGRECEVPHLRGSAAVQALRKQSYQMSGPNLWNCLPKDIRNKTGCSQDEFKELLDQFLTLVPDEPRSDGCTPGACNPHTGRATNTLRYQAARRREVWRVSNTSTVA